MITKASECSITKFMAYSFDGKDEDIEGPELIWAEFIDLSGLCENREKDIMVVMHNICVRKFVIPGLIQFQLAHLEKFEKPYIDGFWLFKKYGHRLEWKEDLQEFVMQMDRIRLAELQYDSQLESLEKDLQSLKKDGVKITGNGRTEFIRLLNDVGKYRRNDIDREKTDIETFALMVKDYFDRPAIQN